MSSRFQLGSPKVAAIFPDSGHGAAQLRMRDAQETLLGRKIAGLDALASAGSANTEVADSIAALGALGSNSLRDLSLEYDRRYNALWCIQNHRERPNFTSGLIRDISAAQSMIRETFAAHKDADGSPLRYLVWE